MLIYGYQQELIRWAGDRIGIDDFGPASAIGVIRRDKIVAVAVFNNLRPPNIEISFVTGSKYWATSDIVSKILGYPFLQLGCKRITATTSATNQPAREFLCRLGFKLEGYHPDSLPTGDAVTYGLLRSDAEKWIGERIRGEIGAISSCST